MKTRKETKLKFYKVMATPTFLYRSESWINNTSERCKIQASEMKFLQSIKKCTRLDHLTNDSIRSDLKIYNINLKIIDYQYKWKRACKANGQGQTTKKTTRIQARRISKSRKTLTPMD